MKSYTDLEQSQVLTKFLPHESADMKWFFWKEEIDAPKVPTFGYSKTAAESYKDTEAVYLPCWSLTALFKVIPKRIKDFNVLRIDIGEEDFSIWYDEVGCGVNTKLPDITMECPVDACYEMVLKLYELKLL